MRRLSPALALAAVLAVLTAPLGAQQRPATRSPSAAQRFDNAYYLWDAGKYDTALVELKRVLAMPEGAALHDRIAELTGEIYTTALVAEDASAPLWSPDGRHLAYGIGLGAARRLVVQSANGATLTPRLDTPGSAPSFSADGRHLSYLTPGTPGAGFSYVALAGGTPQRINVDAPAITQVTLFGSNPTRVALLAGTVGDSTARVLVRDLVNGTWSEVPVAGGHPTTLLRSPDGQRLLVLLGERGAFARQLPGFAQQASRGGKFAELIGSALGPVTDGVMPVWSANGRALAWVDASAEQPRLKAKVGEAPVRELYTLDTRFQAPAISPDGSRIAIPLMHREDWELWTIGTAAAGDVKRITREIQHDHSPRFISNDLLLGVMGEGRHQRSYLYDLRAGKRTRLHHNNTVRTVAPEYDWAVSPDGSRVAIVAERDGDTVTPHRHLWLMDLTRKVTNAELVARVDASLTAERALRENGRRIFAPIATQVRAATSEVNIGRIYEYQKQLFAFDSKHITQPGNWKATEWLQRTYESFGLETRLQRFMTVAGAEIEVANVIATIPGTVNPELVYVVGAHFDSRAEGPGADDNTSGTAMILEAARVLATRPLPATVMFVAFTGEEAGLRGAREFGRRMKDSITVVGALNNDMMGWSNDHRLDNTIRYSNPGLRDVQHAAAIHFSELITYDAFYYKSTDAQALYDAWGDIIAGIGSYPILGNPHYHQVHDVLETINHRQLTETSKATVATIMYMASAPSRLGALVAQGNTATWEPAREKGVARYLVRYGPPENPMQYSANVTNPRITLNSLRAGWHVAVKAVNAQGLEGWDWARTIVR
ncbi:MAG: M20/M25/M40 family metallo-hydrolase [Gemmatimonadaceae bacterium]|nr:M20/M25/M40 family metallo-hydrolase [Gemmatimonadaceae bacterium]MCW5825742.1 M20/M25/M40 family metallo-hydrolase [Gemmatimonadaceae bacterium]